MVSLIQSITPTQTIEVVRPYVEIPKVYAEINNIETIEEKIERIASEYNIASTTLYNLVKSESNFDPSADNGKDRGLVQINRKHWPDITDEQAFDPDFSLRFAAEKIAKGEEYLWTACNCWAYASLFNKLPRMIDIVPNTNYPRVGGLVVLRYKNEKHVATVTSVEKDGFWVKEANFRPCEIGTRFIKWEDKALKGFVDLMPEK